MKEATRRRESGILHLILCAILCSQLVTGCGKQQQAPQPQGSQAKALEKASFRLKFFIYSSFASHFVALDKGYYRDQGLDLKIEPGGPGMDPIRLVATGVDTVGLADHMQILIAREKGIPVVAIGEDYIKSGGGLFALKTSGITKPQDFMGHKVGIMPGTDKHALYEALMKKEGVDRSKITEIPVAFDSTLLLNGTVDVFPGFVVKDPFVFADRGAPVNTIDPYDFGIRPGGNVYFTSEATLKLKRDVLKRFLRATLEGIMESQKMDNGAVVDIVLKYNRKLNKPTEVKIWQATKDLLLEKDPAKVGYMYKAKWDDTAAIGRKYGLLAHDPSIAECYTNALVEEIHKEGLDKK
jgi:ABC-type nitrate/sulfonate/bicarbonate transport system substrate-binding protein